jgi:hypothetical protein
MDKPLSAALESVTAVINRKPFEALASLPSYAVQNLRPAR